MVRRTLKAITAKIGGLHEAAFWLAGFSILSQILAFVRDRLLAYHFGAGEVLDIYYTAFRIPDLIFVTLGSLVSISVLVPMFSQKAARDEHSVRSYINSVFTSFSALIIASCLLAFFFMPPIAAFLFNGFSGEALSQVVKFSRILLLSPLLLGFSNFFGSIVQYEKRFLLYSLSPLFYNAGIITGTAFGASNFGLNAVVSGVVFGAALHLFIPAAFIAFRGGWPKFTAKINWREVRETALVSIPRTLALSVAQIINIVFTAVASFFGAGAIAVWSLAANLQSVPLSIVGASYSLAAFPTLSEHHAKENKEECGKYIGEALRFIVFWTLPLSALFIVLRAHIVRVVLGSGAFDWTDTRLTAAALSLFALSFVFQSASLFLTRAHYALGKTKTPLIFSSIGALATIAAASLFYWNGFAPALSWLGALLEIENLPSAKIIILPVAFSFGSLFTAAGLWLGLDKEIRFLSRNHLLKTFRDLVPAALIIGTITFYLLRIFDDFFSLDSLVGVISHAAVSGLLGLACGAGFLAAVKNREIREIIAKLKNAKR